MQPPPINNTTVRRLRALIQELNRSAGEGMGLASFGLVPNECATVMVRELGTGPAQALPAALGGIFYRSGSAHGRERIGLRGIHQGS
jgi:hypothetical protein